LAAVAFDAGELTIGGGLLALLRPSLASLAPGGVVSVLSREPSLRAELPAWCRLEHHRHLGVESTNAGDRHLIERGELDVLRPAAPAHGRSNANERFTSAESVELVPMPERASADSGFAPRGARVEPGGPAYPFRLLERDHVASPHVATLYDQAVAASWDASRDIPWAKLARLPDELERAVGQVMTFLAENELSALYVPAKFVSRIHPAYAEVAMFLSTQMADEARHLDVFLKRARAFAVTGTSSVTTSRSLLSLLELEDFTEASFLLSVLGEGTFIDLLRFVEQHAPDEVTAEIAKRTRADEARHVHFGMAHVRHALAHVPGVAERLEAAVRRRAATLAGVSSVPAPIQDALTVLAAGGTESASIARGHRAFRNLLETMEAARIKRLITAGFSQEQAQLFSQLHTPNFM
jgi:TusA-related sulfurtransferase